MEKKYLNDGLNENKINNESNYNSKSIIFLNDNEFGDNTNILMNLNELNDEYEEDNNKIKRKSSFDSKNFNS